MNEEKKLRLTVASSPHVASPIDTTNLMRDVLIALVPAMVMGVVFFGPRALVATIISVLACEFFEWGYRKLMHKSCAVKDLSAAVTGVLRAGGDVAWSAALDIAPQWLLALPLTALLALVFKANYWFIAAAIQAESLLKVPLCALRIRTGKWIHDVTLPQGEL